MYYTRYICIFFTNSKYSLIKLPLNPHNLGVHNISGESSPGFDPPSVENNPAPISSFVHELRSVGNGQGQETSPQVPDSNSNLDVQSVYNEVPNVQERTQRNRGTNDDGNVR